MNFVRKGLLPVLGIIIIAALFFGYKIGSAYYTNYQLDQRLTNSVLDIELSDEELEKGNGLNAGEILLKKPFELSEVAPLWEKLSENGELKQEYSYLKLINFFTIVYKSDSLLVNGFVAEPKRDGNYPVIIFNRGGNQKFGKLSRFNTLFSTIYSTGKLISEGYVVVAPCYREQDEFGGSDINDVLSLTKTAASLPKANTNQLGIMAGRAEA